MSSDDPNIPEGGSKAKTLKTYTVFVVPYGKRAKTKGTIVPVIGLSKVPKGAVPLQVDAKNIDAAYEELNRLFSPLDTRPLSGKSYIRVDPVIEHEVRKSGDGQMFTSQKFNVAKAMKRVAYYKISILRSHRRGNAESEARFSKLLKDLIDVHAARFSSGYGLSVEQIEQAINAAIDEFENARTVRATAKICRQEEYERLIREEGWIRVVVGDHTESVGGKTVKHRGYWYAKPPKVE